MTSPSPTVSAYLSPEAEPYALVIIGDRSFRHSLGSPDGARPVVIGRAEDADLRIDDASVSRRHACLELEAGGAKIEDLGSHNGTKLNGALITGARRVASGDVVTIGGAALVLYLARRPLPRGARAGDIIERLEAEVDRALRYEGIFALVLWDVGARAGELGPFLDPVLRPCDAAGVGRDGTMVGVFPGLDSAGAGEVARRGRDLLRAVVPQARAGFAVFPGDATDAATLLLSARDALLAGEGEVGRADQAIQRLALGDQFALVADPGMVRAYDLLRRLAASDLPVLVAGETGVGKELAARALHVWSPRAAGPFVTVNCAALPENLVESELFGHKRGAFSGAERDKIGYFESAGGGTLFLDEIAELPLAAQAKLLRAVDTRTVTRLGQTEAAPIDVRFVAATNRDLSAEVAAKRFRADLFFRLGAAVVVLPPLRDRPREIPILARAFLARARARLQRAPIRISDAAMRLLIERRYPGNVRELANAMEYTAAVTEEQILHPWHLPAEPAPPAGTRGPDPSTQFRPIADEIAELERRRMAEALQACGGNQSRAADAISMSRRTFVTKMGKYGLR